MEVMRGIELDLGATKVVRGVTGGAGVKRNVEERMLASSVDAARGRVCFGGRGSDVVGGRRGGRLSVVWPATSTAGACGWLVARLLPGQPFYAASRYDKTWTSYLAGLQKWCTPFQRLRTIGFQ